LVDRLHGILLTGGSAFGLGAADGVVRWLWERGHGWPTAATRVPIVSAAVLYDLVPGAVAWPDATTGYAACEAATTVWPREGSVGAGRGATVGKTLGRERSSRCGIGAAQIDLGDGIVVGALLVVNALGHIVDPETNQILAGARHPDGTWADSVELLMAGPSESPVAPNTTLGVIWTNAALDKTACNRVADVAHNGLARTIRPVHTQFDGDTLFAIALSQEDVTSIEVSRLSVAATEAVAQAVVRAARHSSTME
jgi:L-aminopeptidase/D-esterase-like protein